MDTVVELTECDSVAEHEDHRIAPLDAVVLKICGQLVFDLFHRSRGNDDTTLRCNDSFLSTDAEEIDEESSSASSAIYTFLDARMARAFDRLYDVVSRDLETVYRIFYQTSPKLELYNELREFVNHYQLHHINRYVVYKLSAERWILTD